MFLASTVAGAVADIEKRARPLFNPEHYEHYYNASYCVRTHLCNNPLKPPLAPGELPRLPAIPVAMLPTGTSSTIELTKTFVYFHDMLKAAIWDTGRYSSCTVDVAIYLALMRRLLGTERVQPVIAALAVHNMPLNGMWHVCKACLLKVYDWCFPWLIVPLRRRINAGQTVYKVAVKVGTVVRTFNYLALAYERDRVRWRRYYADKTAQPAVALEQFFEFLLPFVRTPYHSPFHFRRQRYDHVFP